MEEPLQSIPKLMFDRSWSELEELECDIIDEAA